MAAGALRRFPSVVFLVLVTAGGAVAAVVSLRALRSDTLEAIRAEDAHFRALARRAAHHGRRTRLASGLEEAIVRLRPGVAREEAARYARLVLEASEKYPEVDPLLLASVGIVESGYDEGAVSHAGARGLYQIHPATGRMLARALGWEYSDDLLHDPARNTELAANYLGLLGTAYQDVEMVLAEYNGGPLNAGYFRAQADALAEETKNYVPRVLGVYERLESLLLDARRLD